MPLNIKNPEAHDLARELADLAGSSITQAVTDALREAVGRARHAHAHAVNSVVEELDAIGVHCASLSVLDKRQAEEIMGYDETGLPA